MEVVAVIGVVVAGVVIILGVATLVTNGFRNKD